MLEKNKLLYLPTNLFIPASFHRGLRWLTKIHIIQGKKTNLRKSGQGEGKKRKKQTKLAGEKWAKKLAKFSHSPLGTQDAFPSPMPLRGARRPPQARVSAEGL